MIPVGVLVLAAACIVSLGALCILQARALHHRRTALTFWRENSVWHEVTAEEYAALLAAAGVAVYVDTTARDHGQALDEHYAQVASIVAPDPSRPMPGFQCVNPACPCHRGGC